MGMQWPSTLLCIATFASLTYGQTKGSIYSSDHDLEEVRFPNFSIVIPSDYEIKSPPVTKDGPAIINVRMDPWKIGDISIEEMTFEVDLYIAISWKDLRLTFLGNEGQPWWKRGIISEEEAETIWKPKLNFRNAMGSKGMSFEPGFVDMKLTGQTFFFVIRTLNNTGYQYPSYFYIFDHVNPKYLKKNLFISKAERFHCSFDLSLYPMDSQSCAVEIEALTYKTSIQLQDATVFHEFRSGSDPSQFVVYDHSSGPCTRKDGSARYYSCVEYRFRWRRQIGHHVMLTYVPSSLIVCLTWISFWLDVDATPARVGLGLTSLLTLATQFSSAQKNLPPVAYIKAIDIWMFSCIFMVFGSIVEFAIANYAARRSKITVLSPIKQIDTNLKNTRLAQFKIRSKMWQQNLSVDKFARVAFPLIFFVFVISYCSYYGRTYSSHTHSKSKTA